MSSGFLKDVLSDKEDVDLNQVVNEMDEVDEESSPVAESEEETETEEETDEDQNSEEEDESEGEGDEEEAEESDDNEEEEDPEGDEPNPLEDRLAKLEKRVDDDQDYIRKLTSERDKLKNENVELKEATDQESDEAWMNNEDIDDQVKSQFKKYEDRLNTIEKERQKERTEAAMKLWNAEAAPFKEKHDDFDEMIKTLENGYTEEIKKEFVAAGSTHEAAYKIGKRMYLIEMQTKDPEEYALYLKGLQTKKTKGKKKKTKETIKKITGGSKTPKKGEKKKTESRSMVKNLFPR